MPTLKTPPEARSSQAAGSTGLLQAGIERPPWSWLEGVDSTTGEGIQCE